MGSDMPLAYYFGHLTPSDNPQLYRCACHLLGVRFTCVVVSRIGDVYRRVQTCTATACCVMCIFPHVVRVCGMPRVDCKPCSRHAVEQLAALLEQRCAAATPAAASGMVVNTMGWVEGLGYELLLHAAQALRVDVVLVVGQDRLYSQLSQALQGVTLAKLPKSGGVVTRDPVYRKDARTARVRCVMYVPVILIGCIFSVF